MITEVAEKIRAHQDKLERWFEEKKKGLILPIYSSFDVRNAGFKSVVIDSNVFPAGFNNICEESYDDAIAAITSFISLKYPGTTSIGLVADTTSNPYYYDNILTLKYLFERAGYQTEVGVIERGSMTVKSFSKGELEMRQFQRNGNRLEIDSFIPDLIVVNNDLSSGDNPLLHGISQPITPKVAHGWFQRKKHLHFDIKNQLVKEVSEIIGVDRWKIGAYFEFADDVNFKERKNFDEIAQKIDVCILEIQQKYNEYTISDPPFIFLKGDASTYGMNAIPFTSGAAFLKINADQRAKMHRAKGGREVNEVMIQEGVPTVDQVNNQNAEAVVYCIGDTPIGGFFRSHGKKSATENLNSPGMTFASFLFCPAHRNKPHGESSNITHDNIEVYNFLARLGVIAIAMELKS